MIRCPNLRDEKSRGNFNVVLQRLGGEAMSADDIAPRQPYLAKLNEAQQRAYHVAHYLWNAHDTSTDIVAFLDALDAVQNALRAELAEKAQRGAAIQTTPPQAPETAPSSLADKPRVKVPTALGRPFDGMIENQEKYRHAAKERRERGGSTIAVYRSHEALLRRQGSSVAEFNAQWRAALDAQRPAFEQALKEAEISLVDVPADLHDAILERMVAGDEALTALDSVVGEAEHKAGWLESNEAIDEVEKNRTADERLHALFQKFSSQTSETPAADRSEVAPTTKSPSAEVRQDQSAIGAIEKPTATERTIAGEQSVLPGAERISSAELAKRHAQQPLRPKVAQRSNDEGLFSDERDQTDLVDRARQQARRSGEEPRFSIQDNGRAPGFYSAVSESEVATETHPVHSIDITPALRQAALSEGFPLFKQRGLGRPAEALSGVREGVSGKTTAVEQKFADLIFPALQKELDKIGLNDIALNIEGRLSATAGGKHFELNGYYLQKVITLALDGEDLKNTLYHEIIHALRDLGLFKPGEWAILRREAQRRWRAQFAIDKRYAHLSEAAKDEEGIAHGYGAWKTGDIKVDGRIARLFKRIRNFFRALANALSGLGFKTAEDVFEAIRSGVIGGRERDEQSALEKIPQFAQREQAAVVSGGLQGARVKAPDELFSWLKLPKAEFFANFNALFRKHPRDFSNAEAARRHVLDVLSNADTAIFQRRGTVALVAHVGKDLVAFEVKHSQGRYLIVTAYKLGRGQYERMLQGAERDGALTVRRSIAPSEDEAQSRGVPHASRPDGEDSDSSTRAQSGRDEEPKFSIRDEAAPSEATPTPQLNSRIRALVDRVLSSDTFNKAVEGLQDLSHPVKLLQNELEIRRAGAFDDPESFYVRKRLYPGRLAAWINGFNTQHLDPIVNLLKSNSISLEEAGDYLYALHAAERNAAMDEINPALNGEGSGMADAAASQILAEAKRGEHATALDELRTRVGKIRKLILHVMEKSGLEKSELIDAWRNQYKDYVPLRGWEVEPDDAPDEFKGVSGPGFQVRGKEVKQALGRRSKADNPLVNIFDQAYRTFDRAERNRYLQSLYRALADLGDGASDIAALDRGKPQRKIDPGTGMVRTVEGSNEYFNPRAVYLKFSGNPHFILFRDRELAEAVKRMSPETMGETLQFLLNLQNKLKALWTHYSPDFLFRHFMFRYPIEGALNSFEQKESGEHSVAKYVQESFPFFGSASKAIFASNKGEIASDAHIAELQKYWEEMRRAGGAMMFRNMRDIDLTREHLQTALKALSNRPIANARARWRHAIEAMDTITNALDNSLRLAAYASARRQGKTPQQAALLAREATVDFQVKGRWSNIMGILWPFANVATQTAARKAKAVYRSKMMRRVFMGTMAMGFMTSAFNYLVGGKDKDGVPFFDKIAPWDRQLNFIVLNPYDTDAKGRPQPIKIPMPYNWAFPLFLGYSSGSFIFGSEDARKIAAQIIQSGLQTFTPLGSEGNVAMEFTPEVLRPLGYIYTNLDWAGRLVHVDPAFQRRPSAYSGFRTTGEGWKAGAEALNAATGGGPGHSGFLDLYPEDLRELLDPYIGTQARLAQNIWNTGATVAKGEWPEPTKVPLEHVVRGADYDAADRQRYYELRDLQKHPWKH